MTLAVERLSIAIISVLVRDKECARDVASVWVLQRSVKKLLVQTERIFSDGCVACDEHDLRNRRYWKTTRDLGAAAETTGKFTDVGVAGLCWITINSHLGKQANR